MSQSTSWFGQTPSWVWLSFFPIFGGLAITYAGYKSKTKVWMVLGVGITGVSFILSSTGAAALIWLTQIGVAFYLKKKFLAKTYPKNLPIPEELQLAKLVINTRDKVDINQCSKNELVNGLGLPIVYANNIESVLNEGYIFTHIEELVEIAGIPENYINRLAPLMIFSYDYKKEADFSWRRLNAYSIDELVACGLDGAIAEKIVAERQRRGDYKSLVDVKQRTGLPLKTYLHLA